MKLYKSITLGAIALGAIAFAAQDAVVLKRVLTPGATEVYKIDSKMNTVMQTPGGEMDMAVNSITTMKLTTKSVNPEGVADLESVTTIDKFEMNSPMGAPPTDQMPKEVKATGKLDARNRFKLDKAPTAGMDAMMMGAASSLQSSGMFVEFPESAVKVGDSWEMVIPKSPFTGKEDQKLTATLTGEKKEDGKECWVVAVKGTIKTDLDFSEMTKNNPQMANSPMAGMKILVKGTIDTTGEALVEKSTGKTVSMVSKMKMKQSVEMADMGMTIDSTGEGTTTVKLQG